MTETPIPQDVLAQSQLKLARSRIVRSVVAKGLLSDQDLRQKNVSHLASGDLSPTNQVFGALFPLHNSFDLGRDINIALYEFAVSCLSVVSERKGKKMSDITKEQYNERTGSSVIFVCDGTNREDRRNRVNRLEFIRILVPGDIFPELEQSFGSLQDKVDVVSGKISKRIRISSNVHEDVEIPDYESSIIELFKQRQTTLWLHAVRLPTQSDMRNGKLVKR